MAIFFIVTKLFNLVKVILWQNSITHWTGNIINISNAFDLQVDFQLNPKLYCFTIVHQGKYTFLHIQALLFSYFYTVPFHYRLQKKQGTTAPPR